jgi:hypothetical protein
MLTTNPCASGTEHCPAHTAFEPHVRPIGLATKVVCIGEVVRFREVGAFKRPIYFRPPRARKHRVIKRGDLHVHSPVVGADQTTGAKLLGIES